MTPEQFEILGARLKELEERTALLNDSIRRANKAARELQNAIGRSEAERRKSSNRIR